MQTPRLRFGVIGTARIADALVRAIRLSSNCDLSAVASRDIETAQHWARERGVPHAFGSYEEMLASDDIDAVYIPLPNSLHKEWTMKAAKQGKHVLCEKPLASDASDVEELIALSEQSGVRIMEGFMYLFHPLTARLLELLRGGTIGEIKVVRASFGFLIRRPEDVRLSKELDGGSLMDVGCYCVSIARTATGAEPVSACGRAVWSPGGVDSNFVGVLEFPQGILASIDCGFSTGPAAQQGLVISGTQGRITVAQPFSRGEEPLTIVVEKSDQPGDPPTPTTIEVPGANQYHLMVEHFANAVLEDLPLAYTLEGSLNNMRVIDALRASALDGECVRL